MNTDGSAGDADYGRIGAGYAHYRRPDPRIAAPIEAALGGARTVLNVGAGAGSYEPADREVTAVEPSATMRAQRADATAVVDASAEELPFADDSFDAAMTTFSVHQWSDPEAGLREMRRVSRGPVLVLTCDPDLLHGFWLAEYVPEVIEVEARRYPSIARLRAGLGEHTTSTVIPVPLDCADGFNEAYYGRPEAFLDPRALQACSAWSFVPDQARQRGLERLRAELADGTWDRLYGQLRTQPSFAGSLVLVTAAEKTAEEIPARDVENR
ncbi:class I SAM-dependent methyltransferase [Sciscionella sediminilitoris]|uniref:class I SAM-dependent methyltransferase n=1 Tax=Sciscionella sediminilitoris TaxID=1445613 RepID=UPI00068A12FB|nr:class I SAM-dependent methyltransferase [Sciscionella sp. SE31]